MTDSIRDPSKPPRALYAFDAQDRLQPVRVISTERGIRGYFVRALRDGSEWWADHIYTDWEVPTQQ